MYKSYLYFESIILVSLFFLVFTPISKILGLIVNVFKLLHHTADFYSKHELHMWQVSVAQAKWLEEMEKKIKEINHEV